MNVLAPGSRKQSKNPVLQPFFRGWYASRSEVLYAIVGRGRSVNTFPSPYAAAEVVAVASEYEGGSETLDSRALKSTILETVNFKDSIFLDTRNFEERNVERELEKRRWRW